MIDVLVMSTRVLMRQGLRSLIEQQGDMKVIAESTTGDDFVDQVNQHHPHIALVDGESVCCAKSAALSTAGFTNGTRIVFLCGCQRDTCISRAMEANVSAVVMADDGFDEINTAIRRATDGQRYFAPTAMQRLVFRNKEDKNGAPKTRLQALTRREMQMLRLLAVGLSLKESAAQMGISYKTADKHKVNLMKKLDIHDRVGLARFAIREGVVEA